MHRLNDNVMAEDCKENYDTSKKLQAQGLSNNNNLLWQNAGMMQVSADTREKMIQNQKDAVLRRRRQQFHSGFIKSFNSTQTTMQKLDTDPHVVPTVKTYFSTSKQVTTSTNENVKEQSPYLPMNTRPTHDISSNRNAQYEMNSTRNKFVGSKEICQLNNEYKTEVINNNFLIFTMKKHIPDN